MRPLRRILPIVAGLLLSPAVADAATPMAARVHWSLVAHHVTGVAAGGSYAAYTTTSGTGVLINAATGDRAGIAPPPSCSTLSSVGFGGPWLTASCPGTFFNFRPIAGGAWQTLASPPPFCNVYCVVDSIGSRWMRLETVPADQCGDHCSPSYGLQNLATGEEEADPATVGGHIVPGLSSSAGVAQQCAPLPEPVSYSSSVYSLQPDSLRVVGPYELDFRNDGGVELRRCGSRRYVYARLRFAEDPAGDVGYDRQALVWQTARDALTEVGLPSWRRDVLAAPPHGDGYDVMELALSGRKLYALRSHGGDQPGALYETRLPRLR